ncbi:MAG: phosphoribosylaminoimidazolesuccinocarboxamide synthase [Ruminiclostridium sp.]|nr:phosphoribosylaminoimidazolesuccinocarboxamide synthase [Ruminiclostridium sp.]
MNKKLGIILIIISFLAWAIIAAIPFMGFKAEIKALIIGALAVAGEIFFWSGSVLVGKEIVKKYKHEIKNFCIGIFRNRKGKGEGNMLINNTDFIKQPLFVKGKVRNVYDLGDKLLIVVTDRISAFDVVFSDLIPNKGKVLNSISEFWFNYTSDIIGNHMVTTNVSQYPEGLSGFKEELQGRSMLVRKIEMVNAECIVRGYLEGSGLKEYNATGSICGIKLPAGMKQCQKLPEPIFTPSTKESEGHDISVSFETLAEKIGLELASKLKEKTLALYNKAANYAESKGIILADTKFEFGILDGELIVGDEMFTPDSSRFWDMKDYQPGRPQKSFDKQFLREYLESIAWDKTPPPPKLPESVIKSTEAKYIEAYERLTGRKLA